MDLLDKKTRQRVPNFTADEKVLLAKLVKDRKNIVESKMTDGKSVARKNAAWTSIQQEFNSHSNVYKRDTLTLKRAWHNSKAVARKTRAMERGNLIHRGLRPSILHSQESIMNMVEEAVPSLICKEKNDFDSDCVKLCNMKELSHPLNEQDCDLQTILPPEVQEEPLKKTGDEGSDIPHTDVIISVEDIFQMPSIYDTPTRKASDYVRREGALRLQILETKKRMELQILKLKLDTQEKKNKKAEMLLEAARLEVEFQKKRLGGKNNKDMLEAMSTRSTLSSLDGDYSKYGGKSSDSKIIILPHNDDTGTKNPIKTNNEYQDTVFLENCDSEDDNYEISKDQNKTSETELKARSRKRQKVGVLSPTISTLTSVEFDKLNITQNPFEIQKVLTKLESKMKAAEHEQKLENLRNEDRRKEEKHNVLMTYLKNLSQRDSHKLLVELIKS